MREINRAKRLPQASFILVKALAKSFKDHNMSGVCRCVLHTSISGQCVKIRLTNLQLIPILHLCFGDHPYTVWRLCIIARFSCLAIRSIFPRTSCPFMSYDQATVSARDLSQPGNCSTVPAEISEKRKPLLLAEFTDSTCNLVVYTPSRLDLTEMLVVLRDQLVSSKFVPHGFQIVLLSFHFDVVHMDGEKQALFAVHVQTFSVWNFFPAVFFQDLLKVSFLQQSSQWVSVHMSFEMYHEILNFVP